MRHLTTRGRLSSLLLTVLCLCALVGTAAQQVSDDEIYDRVRVRLAGDRDVGGSRIEVTVEQGVVTLRGTVPKEKIRQKAEKLAKGVRGVRKVVNELTVSPR